MPPPPPGHVIVNMGDAAVKLSGGRLKSGLHRVVPAPDEQGDFVRFSVVYFVRPSDNVVLKRIREIGEEWEEGEHCGDQEEEVTAKEWIRRQARALGLGKGRE